LISPSVQSLIASGRVTLMAGTVATARILTQSVSLYGQDAWKATPRLTVSFGLRWELNPAPSALGNTILTAWANTSDFAQLALAPPGTPLWRTTYGNFAPRVGVAYQLTGRGDFVVRAGWGLFYDLGADSVGSLAQGFPNNISRSTGNISLPISDPSPYLPIISLQPPFPNIRGYSQNLTLPRSYQWNVALEKSFGAHQAVSVTYVGQAGRDLLRQAALFRPNSNFAGEFLLTQNEALSNYNAFQLQYRRPVSSGLQAMVTYSWSHSLDNASNDVLAGLSNAVISGASDYGASDFDVRHSFSGALSYAIPTAVKSGPIALLTKDWFIDMVGVIRTGVPFNAVVASASPDPGGVARSRPDFVPGQPVWISNANAGGGKSLNPLAFSIPSPIRQGTEGRNDIPGFGLTQVDFSVGRKFSIRESTRLQFRADAFNVVNHPNFANPSALFFGQTVTTFLKSAQMLNQGLGGLNPLFQQGGPRSLQLSLKLSF